jgi:hypothetical protein
LIEFKNVKELYDKVKETLENYDPTQNLSIWAVASKALPSLSLWVGSGGRALIKLLKKYHSSF